jgi:hypothetical protein
MFKILSLILLLSFQVADAKPSKSYFDDAVQLADNVWVGRQPDVDDLQELKAKGIDNVVSVSTTREVKKNSYDESTKFTDLGIGYNWLELGRLKSHTPD